MPPADGPRFHPLPGVFEPSAIQQLPDGRFLVVEDEKAHPFALVRIEADGTTDSQPLGPGLIESFGSFWKLDDLEGLTLDPAGRLYAITSHSRDGDGDEKKARDKLVRFRIEADRVVDARVCPALKPALAGAFPLLAAAAEVRDVKEDGGLNIEALEYDAAHGHLLIGFRSPLLDGHAVIARLENPDALFEAQASPRLARSLITLDLAGHGIRGMGRLPGQDGYLVISGPAARKTVQFRLWTWTGGAEDAPVPVEVPGLAGFEHAEGITAATVGGRPCFVLVSDDGSRAANRPARYLVLDAARLLTTTTAG